MSTQPDDLKAEAAPKPAESLAPAPGLLRFVPLAVGVAIAGVVIWLLQSGAMPSLAAGSGPPAPRVGSPAPDFALRSLDGQQVRLSGFRGSRVVLNFWATWCPPCRAEMPDLDAIAREYQDKGVVVLAVDQMESPQTVDRFLSDLHLGLDPLLDEQGQVSSLYRVVALPTTFFVDEQGIIRAVRFGTMSRSTILAGLERLAR